MYLLPVSPFLTAFFLFTYITVDNYTPGRLKAKFADMMKDDFQLKRFKEFLKKEHALENLNFYLQLQSYQNIENEEERQRYSK